MCPRVPMFVYMYICRLDTCAAERIWVARSDAERIRRAGAPTKGSLHTVAVIARHARGAAG